MNVESQIELVAERLGDFGVVAQYSDDPWDTLEVQTTGGLYFFQPGDDDQVVWFGYHENGGVEAIATTADFEETDRNVIAAAIYLGLLQRSLLPEGHDKTSEEEEFEKPHI